MHKSKNADIKPFQFADLQGTHVVSGNSFQPFEFKSLNGESVTRKSISEEEIRTERSFAKKNNFKVDDVVRDSRGIARQEQSDFEKRIEEEVNRRLAALSEEAYQEGLERGREEGKEIALQEFHEAMGQRVEELGQVIIQVQSQTNMISEANREEIYEFVKRFTKWVILKEINEKTYLEALFEKLILELNARKNLIVKVGQRNFAEMPEVIQAVEARIGQLSNVRIEIVPEIQHPGIILESENGLIDGSMEGVFQNIDKIFEQVIQNGSAKA